MPCPRAAGTARTLYYRFVPFNPHAFRLSWFRAASCESPDALNGLRSHETTCCVTHDRGGREHRADTGTRAAPKNQRQPSYYVYAISNYCKEYYSVLNSASYTCTSYDRCRYIFVILSCGLQNELDDIHSKVIATCSDGGHSNKPLKQCTFSAQPCML